MSLASRARLWYEMGRYLHSSTAVCRSPPHLTVALLYEKRRCFECLVYATQAALRCPTLRLFHPSEPPLGSSAPLYVLHIIGMRSRCYSLRHEECAGKEKGERGEDGGKREGERRTASDQRGTETQQGFRSAHLCLTAYVTLLSRRLRRKRLRRELLESRRAQLVSTVHMTTSSHWTSHQWPSGKLEPLRFSSFAPTKRSDVRLRPIT